MGEQTCNNCKHKFKGNFCSNCGQRSIANKRLHPFEVVQDFIDNTFNLDKGFFYTFWQLIIKPGYVAQAYIDGQRKKFTNPTRFLIIAMAYQAFVDYWFATPEVVKNDGYFTFSILSDQLNQNMALWHIKLTVEYPLLANLQIILFYPLLLLIIFKKQRYNYTELLTLSFYHISTFNIIGMTCVLGLNTVANFSMFKEFIILVFATYFIWSAQSFFRQVPPLIRFSKIVVILIILILFRLFGMQLALAYFFPLIKVI